MQLGWARITPTEREHWRRDGLCRYCASSAHTITSCPAASSRAYNPGTPKGVDSSAQEYRVSRLINPPFPD